MVYMLQNGNADYENKKLNRYANNALRRSFYEILDYELKPLQIKTSSFSHFPLMAWVQFSKKIYLC